MVHAPPVLPGIEWILTGLFSTAILIHLTVAVVVTEVVVDQAMEAVVEVAVADVEAVGINRG